MTIFVELLSCLSILLFTLLLLLVSLLLELFTGRSRSFLLLLLSLHLLHELCLLFSSGSVASSTLSCLFLSLLGTLLFDRSKLLSTLAFDSCDACLSLTLGSSFSLLLSPHGCHLTIFLFLALLLLLLLKDLLKLLDRAVVLVSQLLQLRSVLFLLLALAGFLSLLVLAHELCHQLVSLLASLIEQVLALLDDLDGTAVVASLADGQSCVTGVIALKNVDFGVFDNILEDRVIDAVLRCKVQDIVIGIGLTDEVVRILAKECLNHFDILHRGDQSKLQRCELVELGFEGSSPLCEAIGGLESLGIDEALVDSIDAVIEDF